MVEGCWTGLGFVVVAIVVVVVSAVVGKVAARSIHTRISSLLHGCRAC